MRFGRQYVRGSARCERADTHSGDLWEALSSECLRSGDDQAAGATFLPREASHSAGASEGDSEGEEQGEDCGLQEGGNMNRREIGNGTEYTGTAMHGRRDGAAWCIRGAWRELTSRAIARCGGRMVVFLWHANKICSWHAQ